jgi:hypothetical protein
MRLNILELPVFYINLKKEKQKDVEMRQILSTLGFKNFQRFDGVLGDNKTEGCAKSHQRLLQEIDVDGPFIVFEDDIEVSGGFNPIVDVPDDADAVYLGISKYSLEYGKTSQDLVAEKIDDELYRIYNMLAAHAILYLNNDYPRFLSKAITAMLDANRNQDNARAETMKYFNVYCLTNPLFYQGGRHRDVTKFKMNEIRVRPYGNHVLAANRRKAQAISYELDHKFYGPDAPNITVVILSWRRPEGIKTLLDSLSRQTYSNFSVYISNGNLGKSKVLQNYANAHRHNGKMKVSVGYDTNDLYAFRRLVVAKRLAEAGTDIILYLDDDVTIPNNYMEMCLSQYEPKTYHSGFAWSLFNNGEDYYKHRKRQWDNKYRLQYCGTGVSMIDAQIFLEDELTNPEHVPIGAYKVEDLWLSYYADHILKWKLKYIDIPGTVIGGGDSVALYRQIQKEPYDKADFLRDLVSMGWKIPKEIVKA